jgi:sulfite exporter TauE/SafE
MTDPILLTDVEIAAVAGGAIWQSIEIDASQRNTSSMSQTTIAINSGRVTATATGTGATVAAVGASASNFAAVSQINVIVAVNSVRFGHY